jgi:membrane protease YdiL (CAAX protease family)
VIDQNFGASSSANERLRERLFAWKIIGSPPYYGFGEVLLLCLFVIVGLAIIHQVHKFAWEEGLDKYWYYDSPLTFVLVTCVVFYRRPQLLAVSRWRPRWIDLAIGIVLGFLVPLVLWLSSRDPVNSAGLRLPQSTSFFPIICLSPIFEEIFCRATILKSFKSYLPISAAVLLTAILVSILHLQFWAVFPMQLALSIVYVALGDSLPASIAAHITNNASVLLLATGVFQKWHVQLWSFWK